MKFICKSVPMTVTPASLNVLSRTLEIQMIDLGQHKRVLMIVILAIYYLVCHGLQRTWLDLQHKGIDDCDPSYLLSRL
jgi:hypothetical protein